MSLNFYHFEIQEGDMLNSGTNFYHVNKFIGSGAFGRVAKSVNLTERKDVALKILKAKKSSAARREIEMLQTVQVLDPLKTNLVQCFEVFEYAGFTCLAFEMLDRSLLQLMADRKWEPLSISEIRPIAQQLLTAFDALKSIGVIHADLKPDNIMLVNHRDQPFRVKLIDFGLSLKTSEVKTGTIMQIDAMRAPEVFLGLPLSEAIDMWSLGCVLYMLYTSSHLFGCRGMYEVLRNIVEIIGQPADHLLDAGLYTKRFFKEDEYSNSPKWWLKTPAEYHRDSGSFPQLAPRTVNSLRDLTMVTPEMEECTLIADRRAFVGLLMCLLNIDPHMRIDPGQALRHSFISMVHLEEQRDTTDYADEAFEQMSCTIQGKKNNNLSVSSILVEIHDNPEAAAHKELSPDSNGSTEERAPKTARSSRLKRVKKFFSRAIRRVFGLRKSS